MSALLVGRRRQQAVPRPGRGRPGQLRGAGGRHLRGDRPERRRQDHAVQHDRRRVCARRRHHHLRRRAHRRACRPTASAGAASAAPSRSCGRFRRSRVEDNVIVGALLHRHRVDAARTHAHEVLRRLDLYDKRAQRASSLTLPDRKRLEVARALATDPKLLLLDEVMAGLRPTETDRIVAILQELNRETGLTILLIEHVMRAVMALASRILVLHHGAAIAEGAPQRGGARSRGDRLLSRRGGGRIPTSIRKTDAEGRKPRRLLRRRPGARRRLARDRARAPSSPSSAPTAPARPRSSAPSPACSSRRADAFSIAAPISPAGRATRSAISASARSPKAARFSRRCRSPRIWRWAPCCRARARRAGAISTASTRCFRPWPSAAISRRHAVRRRAADARHRPLPDGRAGSGDVRRAVARSRADRGAERAARPCATSIARASPACWWSRTWRSRSSSPAAPMCWRTAASRSPAAARELLADDRVRQAYLGL